MSVLINFKICDNAKECGGIEVCPTGALSWDEESETIKIDNSKCICCGACERSCPVGAIKVAFSDEEYDIIAKQIEDDPRTVKDLFVDRYGAAPLSEFFMIKEEEIENKLTDGIVLVELYNDDSIECLLKSIPIKEITRNYPSDTLFYKALSNNTSIEFPCLLVYKNRKLLGEIEGYYTVDQKEELLTKIKNIIGE